jgi:hypothetical protein
MKINTAKVKAILKAIGVVAINLILGAIPGAGGPFLVSDRNEEESSTAVEQEGASLE